MKAALIFSGYNQRAVIALCRYLTGIKQLFIIISANENDPIYKTDYRENVVLERSDNLLTFDLFREISGCYGRPLVYLPTSEFLNSFVLNNVESLDSINIQTGMPHKSIYYEITNKWSCQRIINKLSSIKLIKSQSLDKVKAPCVIKPYENVHEGKVLYPFICLNDDNLKKVRNSILYKNYFAQQYIDGQSYYYCAYISRYGDSYGYWQANFLQQPDGKSIVFAKLCENPGIDTTPLTKAISELGYFGPMMIEFIRNDNGFYFIEINPRFWGPLQLCVDAFPKLLDRYMFEWFDKTIKGHAKASSGFYSWYYGLKSATSAVKRYPELESIKNSDQLMLDADIYSRPDTIELSLKH